MQGGLHATLTFHPFGSITRQQAPVDVDAFLAEMGDKTHMMWTMQRENGEAP